MALDGKRDIAKCLRARVQAFLWTAEAGVISRDELKERFLATLPELRERGAATPAERQRFANHLFRDLQALDDAGLLCRIESEGAGGIWYAADPEVVVAVLSAGGPRLDVVGLREYKAQFGHSEAARGWAALELTLADLMASAGAFGPGQTSSERLRQALWARRGLEAPSNERMSYRALPPALGLSGRRTDPSLWTELARAFEGRRKIEVRLGRSKKFEGPYVPCRVVWYNGRPRLELYRRRGGVCRFRVVPIAFIRELRVLDQSVDPSDGPTPQERAVIARTWGMDLDERDARGDSTEVPTRALADRETEVLLTFRGEAADAVFADKGCADARVAWGEDEAGRFVSYEVRTIVGPYFKRWLRMWGPQVKIEAPIELAQEAASEAAAIAAQYAPAAPSDRAPAASLKV